MAGVMSNSLGKGKAYAYGIIDNSDIVLGADVLVIDPDTNDIRLGDGKTPGGVEPYVWKVADEETLETVLMEDGDYALTDIDRYYYYDAETGTKSKVDILDESDSDHIDGWQELDLLDGWGESDDSTDDARIRIDGSVVTIDAVLSKAKNKDYSPFRLPEWARPSKTLYKLVEGDNGQGAIPIVMYPDGYIYPRRHHSKSVKRIAFQLSYFVGIFG